MGADLYLVKKRPKTWGFERSQRAVDDGYFRDPYNELSVLGKYGLSWWQDIIPLRDTEGRLSVEKTKIFLAMLEEREADFENNIKTETVALQKDFREGAQLLKQLLRDAIELESSIDASL